MPREERKRHASQQAGGPSNVPNTSSSHRPSSKHNSGSNSRRMSPESTDTYNNLMMQFNLFCKEHSQAYANRDTEKDKLDKAFQTDRHKIALANALTLQKSADNAKPEDVRQQRMDQIKAMAHEKLEAIEQEFKTATRWIEHTVAPEWQGQMMIKAKQRKYLADHRAEDEARSKLFDPAEADAAALTAEGIAINRRFDELLQELLKAVDNGASRIESGFISEIRNLIFKQSSLKVKMDEAILRHNERVRERSLALAVSHQNEGSTQDSDKGKGKV